jgi:hypothetical protein
MLPFGGLMATIGANCILTEGGAAGKAVTPPGQLGAIAGDYAFWVNASPPSGAWQSITSAHILIFGKILTDTDMGLAYQPGQSWIMAVYRDVTSVAVRSWAGFAKSPAHMGVVAVGSQNWVSLTTPAGSVERRRSSTSPAFSLVDLLPANTPYNDGTAFAPNGEDNWSVIELLRS